jgi:hypothetical protein
MGKFEKGKLNPGARPFQKGVSGNPGGKPKAVREVALAARAYTMEAIETLAKIMRDAKATASARVSAATVLIERGWGKAPVTITLNRDSDLKDLTDDELLAIASGATNGSGDPSASEDDPQKPH